MSPSTTMWKNLEWTPCVLDMVVRPPPANDEGASTGKAIMRSKNGYHLANYHIPTFDLPDCRSRYRWASFVLARMPLIGFRGGWNIFLGLNDFERGTSSHAASRTFH